MTRLFKNLKFWLCSTWDLHCRLLKNTSLCTPTAQLCCSEAVSMTDTWSLFRQSVDSLSVCLAGKTVNVVPDKNQPRMKAGREWWCGNEWDEEVEEYLQTANWQLGNRRVRCCLMSDTRREEERKEVDTHSQRMDCWHRSASLFVFALTS